MAHKYPAELNTLIAHLRKLPGVGTRTAERFAFELIRWPRDQLIAFGEILRGIQEKMPPCDTCGSLTQLRTCPFCHDPERNKRQLCIVASQRDVFAVEETLLYKGLYHVIEHLLSPLDGRSSEQISIERIKKRIEKEKTEEIILAFDSTLEGDTTALYLRGELQSLNLSISRLAFGIPIGSSLEYIDGGTLARALRDRQTF